MVHDRGVVPLVLLLFACASEERQLPHDAPLPPPDQRGPAVGQPLPPLSLPDQDGRVRSFDSLRGANGLLLVLVQSADW
jgi:hypothetical protein